MRDAVIAIRSSKLPDPALVATTAPFCQPNCAAWHFNAAAGRLPRIACTQLAGGRRQNQIGRLAPGKGGF